MERETARDVSADLLPSFRSHWDWNVFGLNATTFPIKRLQFVLQILFFFFFWQVFTSDCLRRRFEDSSMKLETVISVPSLHTQGEHIPTLMCFSCFHAFPPIAPLLLSWWATSRKKKALWTHRLNMGRWDPFKWRPKAAFPPAQRYTSHNSETFMQRRQRAAEGETLWCVRERDSKQTFFLLLFDECNFFWFYISEMRRQGKLLHAFSARVPSDVTAGIFAPQCVCHEQINYFRKAFIFSAEKKTEC